jgi:hypothetical protein
MARILLVFFVLGFMGCASTAGHKGTVQSGFGPKAADAEEMQGSNVYGAIKALLQQGATVNIMVDYQSSFDGMTDGYQPVDFGCEVDSDTIMETEKIFLLDSFSKNPHFNVIDRSKMNVSFNEMKLGMSDLTSSNMRPGEISGVSHLIVIESRNHFFHRNGKYKDRYTEIKKLLDIQKDVVIAMDKLSEEREVESRWPGRPATKYADRRQSASPILETIEFPSTPSRIEPASASQDTVETIRIYGDHRQPTSSASQVVYQSNPTSEMASINGYGTQQMSIQAAGQLRRIPDWQLARIVKQRFPSLRNKDTDAIVRHFIEKHPAFRGRIISTRTASAKK